METSDYISLFALVVALASFGLSTYVVFVDRPRVHASCRGVRLGDDAFKLEVIVKNYGRRPVVLTHFGRTYEDGHYRTVSIEPAIGQLDTDTWSELAPVRLGEGESYSKLLPFDSEGIYGLGSKTRAISLWFQDAVGRRYTVRNYRKLVAPMEPYPHKEAFRIDGKLQLPVASRGRDSQGRLDATLSGNSLNRANPS